MCWHWFLNIRKIWNSFQWGCRCCCMCWEWCNSIWKACCFVFETIHILGKWLDWMEVLVNECANARVMVVYHTHSNDAELIYWNSFWKASTPIKQSIHFEYCINLWTLRFCQRILHQKRIWTIFVCTRNSNINLNSIEVITHLWIHWLNQRWLSIFLRAFYVCVYFSFSDSLYHRSFNTFIITERQQQQKYNENRTQNAIPKGSKWN